MDFKGKTLLYSQTVDWSFSLFQRPHQLALCFADAGWQVYWVDKTQIPGKAREQVHENITVYHDWNVFKKRVPYVDVYFSSWALRYRDLNEISAKLCIYDSLDNFEQNEPYEPQMINYADIVLTASKPLYDLRKTQHPYVHLVRNACNYNLTNQYTDMPTDLSKIKKPILLFSGALAKDWCDIELMERIAKMSQYSVVVVGLPWGLHIPPDIIYLGAKSYTELQKYYNNCDLTLLPFRRCQIADFSNPLKMYESLAAGKPVISTSIPEACEYPGVILTSENHDEFIKNIKKALALNKSEFSAKAKKVAQENTWDIRYQQIIQAIEEYCEKEDITI